MTTLAVGAATRDITPDWPISLAGFASRTHLSEGARHPIHVRVIVLESTDDDGAKQRIVIAGGDFLNWGAQQAPRLRQELADLAGTTSDHVLLAATHSHSGPQTSFGVASGVGVADQRFIDLLDERTREAARAALESIEPVAVHRGQSTFPLGMFRRVPRDGGEVAHTLTKQGPVDHRLTAVRFMTPDGRVKAVLVHYTCHPVIVAEHYISPEYTGFAMSRIEQVAETTSLYLQGFCGDINPDWTGKQEFRRGADEDVQRVGGDMADLVLAQFTTAGDVLDPVSLTAEETTVDLPFQQLPDEGTLRAGLDEPGVVGEWSQMMLDHPEKLVPTIPLVMQRLDLAQGLSLLTLNGEISVEYGLKLRERTNDTVLPVGYSNGMIGYVTTAQQIIEGGYEPVESTRYYGLPAPFATEIEALITSRISDLVP
jgi:hypothetical protein